MLTVVRSKKGVDVLCQPRKKPAWLERAIMADERLTDDVQLVPKIIWGTAVSLIVAFAATIGSISAWTLTKVISQDGRIEANAMRIAFQDESMTDLKVSQKDMQRKLDEILKAVKQ